MRAFTLCLARCNYEDINISVSTEDLRTPLHLACATGNLAMAQLLIWVRVSFLFMSKIYSFIILCYNAILSQTLQHKANPQNLDHEGRTCMSYVRALERTLDNSSDSMEMQKLLEVLEQASVSGMDDIDTSQY